MPQSLALALRFPPSSRPASGGGGGVWPEPGSIAGANFILKDYFAPGGAIGVNEVAENSDYQDNGQPEGGSDFRLGGPFVAADDIAEGGIILAGYGPHIFGVRVPDGPLLDEVLADERTIIIEFEDITGAPSMMNRLAGLMLWAQDDDDTYTIEIDADGSGGIGFYDYGDFDVTIEAGYTWHASGVNRLGVTFSSGQASISINGDAAVSGALDRGLQPVTQFHLGPYLGADIALQRVVVFPAMSDAALAAATAVANPAGVLDRADAGLYDLRYYEVFDGTAPLNFVKNFVGNPDWVADWFYTGSDPYLWDVTNPNNVNLTPLPGVNCVIGSGLNIPMDLSLLPAWDATIYLNLAVNERMVFVIEWLETQGDVDRKAGLLTEYFNDVVAPAVPGYLQAYFENGHFKLHVKLLNGDDSTNLDVTLVGPPVEASTITRAAFLWDPATGALAASVNGGAAVVGVALPADAATVGSYGGKPVGYISEPDAPSGTGAGFYGVQTVSAPLGGYLRHVDSLHPTWGVADLPTLSAL